MAAAPALCPAVQSQTKQTNRDVYNQSGGDGEPLQDQ